MKSSSICGGRSRRFPCYSYHLHVHAGVYYLSDGDIFVSSCRWLLRLLTWLMPCIPESPVGWTDENELHEPRHFRPPLLPAYFCVRDSCVVHTSLFALNTT